MITFFYDLFKKAFQGSPGLLSVLSVPQPEQQPFLPRHMESLPRDEAGFVAASSVLLQRSLQSAQLLPPMLSPGPDPP